MLTCLKETLIVLWFLIKLNETAKIHFSVFSFSLCSVGTFQVLVLIKFSLVESVIFKIMKH